MTIIGFVAVSTSGGSTARPWMAITMGFSVLASVAIGIYSYIYEKRRQREQEKAYRGQLAEMTSEMHLFHEMQRYFYRYNYPEFRELYRIVEGALAVAQHESPELRTEARLWQRRPHDEDFGVVRIGLGTLPSTVIYTHQKTDRANDVLARLAEKLAHDSCFVDDIPFILKLRQAASAPAVTQEDEQRAAWVRSVPVAHSLGIAGEDDDEVYRFVRSVLADYVVFHSPDEAKLYVIAEQQAPWSWSQELQHCQPDDQGTYLFFADAVDNQYEQRSIRFDEEQVDAMDTFTEHLRSMLSQRKIRAQAKDDERENLADPRLPFLLVVVDLLKTSGDSSLSRLHADAAMAILLEEGDELGAAVFFLARTRRQIPGECKAVIEIEKTALETVPSSEQRPKLIYRFAGVGTNGLKAVGEADRIGAGDIAALTNLLRRLVPYEGYGANLTRSVPFLNFMGCRTVDELIERAAEKWTRSVEKEQSGWLRAKFSMVLGNKPRSLIFSADKDGVHGMIAGSTGSGKSELLISMLMSMAATYSPEVLNFVLVDYKGGTTFQDFRKLPHCVGVITNLGVDGVERMFASITAELNRRQALGNILEYRRRGLHHEQPYPFLFIIIDEFAEMMAANPDFKTQLESITRTGRAQGVSLILAAQRPSGVTDQMRSNMKLRICLRVESPAESREILRRSEAAFLPNGIPGRGYLQVGNEELEMIQISYTGDRINEKQSDLVHTTPADGSSPQALHQSPEPVVLYQELIRRLNHLAVNRNIPTQYAPWPDFLPTQLALSTLLLADPAAENSMQKPLSSTRYLEQTQIIAYGRTATYPLHLSPALVLWQDGGCGWIDKPDWQQTALCPVIGLVDDPAAARQYPLFLSLRRGHAAIFGAPGSGKTTAVRTLAVSLLSAYSPRHLHLYIMDLGGRNLNLLSNFPQVGAVISPEEESYRERVQQLIHDLVEEMNVRRLRLAQAKMADVYEYNAAHPDDPIHIIVVLLDNFTEFRESFGDSKDNVETVLDKMTVLMRSSRTYGIHFVLTATQPGLFSNQLYNLCTERIALRMTDASLYRDIVGQSVIQFASVSGRGYTQIGNRALSVQIAQIAETTEVLKTAGNTVTALANQLQAHLQANPINYPPLLSIGALPQKLPFHTLLERQYGIAFTQAWPQQLADLMQQRWKENLSREPAAWLETTLGVMAGNRLRSLHLSSDQDGVHGIIAGGTGAGKSALLTALIAHMVVNYHPSMLNFVLVDYKGGGTFKAFEKLPHCVDMVTNLNKSAVRRMFTAIRAEMERRQQINTAMAVQDIVQYRQKGLHHQRPYPHLLIIIDEYAQMIADSPDFQHELDLITQQGRALGVQLILASQKPVGVTDQMRANISLRICLRVEGADTSRELLRRSDAAYLPRIGGRGYLQVGNDEIALMQVAYVGDSTPVSQQGSGAQATFLEMIVHQSQQLTGNQRQLAPWPHPLPSRLPMDYKLEPQYLEENHPAQVSAEPRLQPDLCAWLSGVGRWDRLDWLRNALHVTCGLIDDPSRAKQGPFDLDLTKGHVVLFAASGWGKTTFLRSLILSAMASHGPDALHVYILDLGRRELSGLRPFPHVGPIIMPDEEGFAERVQQLLRDIDQIIDERKRLFEGAKAPDLLRYNQQAQNAQTPICPAILVAIDNFDLFVEMFDSHARDEGNETVLDSFVALAGRAKAYGVHFVVTAGRPSALARKVYSLFAERLTLRLADAGDYADVVGPLLNEPESLPGRGYVKQDRHALAFQIAVLPGAIQPDGQVSSDAAQTEQLAGAMWEWLEHNTLAYSKPVRIEPLARRLSYRQLLTQEYQLDVKQSFVGQLKQLMADRWKRNDSSEAADWLQVLIGTAAGNRPRILQFEAQKDGAHGIIAGGTGSGKSELLMTLVAGLAMNYSPDILNFVLVDYKGGGAFKPFEHLPHCVDLVTNLNKSEVDRMFTAISSEIKRRQQLIAELKPKPDHIVDYRKRGLHITKEPYPHLFVIIDEYAEMIANSPEYGEALDTIARTGRAQGVHLLLAAQQPKGVSGQMRANMRLRLCMRVEERDTSVEMLGRPDAVQLPSIPGRGYLQIGHRGLELIQVAWTGEQLADDRPAAARPQTTGDSSRRPFDTSDDPKLYDMIVELANELVNEQDIQIRRPWPAFLPHVCTLESPLYDTQRNRSFILSPAVAGWIRNDKGTRWPDFDWEATGVRCTLGIVDDPWQARQEPFVLELLNSHHLVFGQSGSGKTSFLRTLITSLAATYSPQNVHIYAIDHGGRNFAQQEGLPHVGAVIYGDDETYEERQQALFQLLQRTVRRRQRLLGEQSLDFCQYNNRFPDQALPAIVLLIDNFIEFYENNQDAVDTYLVPLLRHSFGLGISIVCTSNTPSGVPAWLYNLFSTWLTLSQSDPDIYFDILGRKAPEVGNIRGRGGIRARGD